MADARMSLKGQLALEFLTIYIFFVALFAVAIFTIYGISARQQLAAYTVLANSATAVLANEISVANEFVGYEKNLSLPRTIGGLRYTATISNGTLIMSYELVGANATVAHALPTSAIVVGKTPTRLFPEQLDVERGWIVIKNVNGTIVIE